MAFSGLIHQFSNIGLRSQARSFPGFPSASEIEHYSISPRGLQKCALRAGDLLWLATSGPISNVLVIAFDDKGHSSLPALGFGTSAPADLTAFEASGLIDWCRANGGDAEAIECAAFELREAQAFKAESACTLWIASSVKRANSIEGLAASTIKMTVKRAEWKARELPDPLGTVREEFTISRGTAQAYEVDAGEYLQIIDIEGQQCSDFMAFRSRGLEDGREVAIDSTSTRSMVRHTYPGPGLFDKFFDAEMRPMLRVVQDTCGRHDALGLACTARGYEERGFPGHLNCSDNISDATAAFGVARRAAWPAINFFWNTWIDQHSNQILTEESFSRPGDYVALQALDPLVCVSTACPDDIDPINGWNPTDVHVRIYRPDAPIKRAIAYRVKEDAPMSISRESAFHSRTSALTKNFATARDLWAPVSFPATGSIGEYWACRDAVTVQDMSSLRKYDIAGPDAERLLQRVMTRDIARLAVWRGTYALICDETGTVVDDGTLFRLAPDIFRWCCGTEESVRILEHVAKTEALNVRLTDMSDALVNLSVQGPRSRKTLDNLVFTQPHVPPLDQVKWFGVTIGRLRDREGAPFMLTRSGYTGELGYEVFCAPSDAGAIWDAVMEEGQAFGILPMGSEALEIARIEAGLAAAGREFAPGVDAFEAGLGFAVDLQKSDFIGKAALLRNSKEPRRVLKGLQFQSNEVPLHGAPVFIGERQIGQVTSATRSPKFECSIAMARLAVEVANEGTHLEVGMLDGRLKKVPCTVKSIPFYDPKRERARA